MTIDLKPFCSRDFQSMAGPIDAGTFRYATNGFSAIRVPANGRPAIGALYPRLIAALEVHFANPPAFYPLELEPTGDRVVINGRAVLYLDDLRKFLALPGPIELAVRDDGPAQLRGPGWEGIVWAFPFDRGKLGDCVLAWPPEARAAA